MNSGLTTYINSDWSGKSSTALILSGSSVYCAIVKYFLKFPFIMVMCTTPCCSIQDNSLSHDVLIPSFVPLLTDCLSFIVGDIIHIPTYPVIAVG